MGNAIYNIIMFIVNFAFFLVGAAVMSFGIVILANPGLIEGALNSITGYQNINYVIDLNSALSASGILLTTVGAVIMAISLIGLATCCCGGSCLYIIYSAFLGLIIAFEVAVIIYISVNYNNVQSDIESYMYTALTENFEPVYVDNNGVINYSPQKSAQSWQYMQFNFGCCGAYGPSDYTEKYTAWNVNKSYVNGALETLVYPPSCCIQINQYQLPNHVNQLADYAGCVSTPVSTVNPTATPYVNSKGCYLAIMNEIAKYSYITNIIIVSLIALEVIILQLTVHQCYAKKLEENKVGFM